MDLRELTRDDDDVLADYSDFGDEFAVLMAQELSESARRGRMPVRADTLLDAINRFVDSKAIELEKSPDDVGAIQDYQRRATVHAALALAIAKALRKCRRRSINTGPFLVYVAIRSDNDHGRCTDSAQRIGDYLRCAEDVVRDIRDDLVLAGALREEKRTGLPSALWLPYPPEVFLHSDFAILDALAPPRAKRGRPTLKPVIEEKTSGTCHPMFHEKRRVLPIKTSGTFSQNVGLLTPDSKNSLQELTAREVTIADDLTVAAREVSSSSNSLSILNAGEVQFGDSEQSAIWELARLGYAEPTEAQVVLIRADIVGCLSKFGPGKGYRSPADWFRARFAPRLTAALKKASTETPTTGNSVADAIARRFAQIGGAA